MFRKTILPIMLLSSAGCLDWDNLPDNGYRNLDAPLWDSEVVAVDSGIYVHLLSLIHI